MWRVMTGLNPKITLNFMVAGHTKFRVDANFGHIKRAVLKKGCQTTYELENLINSCTVGNCAHNVLAEPVRFTDWKQFLDGHFDRKHKFPGIRKLQQFIVYDDGAGHTYYQTAEVSGSLSESVQINAAPQQSRKELDSFTQVVERVTNSAKEAID